jgi:hypothetical protein
MKTAQDAIGRAMLDFQSGQHPTLLIERDDGYIVPDYPMTYYFSTHRAWPS